MKLFAVAGNPILSSCSPLIWNYSFKKKKIDAHYFRISADTAYDIIEMVKGIGLSGCNVTSPFKEDILDHIDKVEGDAAKIRAVNCIAAIGKKLIGYNTDVDGFYSALILNGFNPQDKKVVVVGAGGAAKAVIYALMKNGAYDVVIANRTYEKAKALSEIFNCRICSIDKIEKETKDADLLVSCVSTLDRVIKKDAIYKKLTVMDAKYNGVSTLLKDAEFAGCKIIDGKEWLICQAAFFFKDFFNELPVDQMKEALKKGHSKDLKDKKSISLIGFMGTGKSSLGKALAEKLQYQFVDVDAQIEKKEKMSISEIFAKRGEAYFRQVETDIITSIDHSLPTVVSCGGGAVIEQKNVEALRFNSKVFWLWNTLEEIKKRITSKGRPLFAEADEIFHKRTLLYAKACDICINNKEEKNTLKQILKELAL